MAQEARVEVIALLASLLLQDGIDQLIERWRSDDPDVRSRGDERVLSRWKEWTDADLARVERAAADPDSEVSQRAGQALRKIRARRRFGPDLLREVEGIDDTFDEGTVEARWGALLRALDAYRDRRLSDDDMKALAEGMRRCAWPDRERSILALAEQHRPLAAAAAPFLKDPAGELRGRALSVLGKWRARGFASEVLPLLRDEEAFVRWAAAEAVGRMRYREGAAALGGLLGDVHSGVRARAAEAVGLIGAAEHAAALAALLKDDAAEVRWKAAEALGRLGDARWVPAVAALLEDPLVCGEAAFALGRLGARGHARGAAALLRDARPRVRRFAVLALAQLGAPEYAAPLKAALGDPDFEVRQAAAWAAPIWGPYAGPDAVPLLADRSASVRASAVLAVTLMNERGTAPRLVPLLADEDSLVRWNAFAALRELGGREESDALGRFFRDRDAERASLAVVAAGELGARHLSGREKRERADELEALQGSAPARVSTAVLIALVRLGEGDRSGARGVIEAVTRGNYPSQRVDLAEALAARFEPQAWARLRSPLTPAAAIESAESLKALAREGGIELGLSDDAVFSCRMPAGVSAPLRTVLDWCLGPGVKALFPEGNKVRVVAGEDALPLWQKHLGGP